MIYRFLRVLVGFTLRIFFRKIYVTGTEHIDHAKAQLIASNHPSGFLEPLIMACFFPKPLHFLVRGDVFDNPVLKPLLRATNQIPVFRFRDGFSKLRENNQSIDESLEVLRNKQNLLIFVEGNTQSIKKLRPLQKGISRIAFQTLEQNPDSELEILPVGINFSKFLSFDEYVMLRIGAPIKVKEYANTYNQDKNTGHQHLLNDVFDAMKKNVIHLENQDRLHIFEKLRKMQQINNSEIYLPVHSTSDMTLQREINLAQKIDGLSDDKLQSLKDQIKDFEKLIKSSGITFDQLHKKPLGILQGILLITGFIPALFGLVTHFIPLLGGYTFTKTQVKQLEFKSSILMVSTLAQMLIYYIVIILIVLIFQLPAIVLPGIIISGLWHRYYYSCAKSFSLISKNRFSMIQNAANKVLSGL